MLRAGKLRPAVTDSAQLGGPERREIRPVEQCGLRFLEGEAEVAFQPRDAIEVTRGVEYRVVRRLDFPPLLLESIDLGPSLDFWFPMQAAEHEIRTALTHQAIAEAIEVDPA